MQFVDESKPVALAAIRDLCLTGSARAIREAAGLSLGEIADHVGVSLASVSRWERAEQKPTGEHALRYLSLLRALCNPRRPLRRPARTP